VKYVISGASIANINDKVRLNTHSVMLRPESCR